MQHAINAISSTATAAQGMQEDGTHWFDSGTGRVMPLLMPRCGESGGRLLASVLLTPLLSAALAACGGADSVGTVTADTDAPVGECCDGDAGKCRVDRTVSSRSSLTWWFASRELCARTHAHTHGATRHAGGMMVANSVGR